MRHFHWLRAQNPRQFDPPPFSLAMLNWRALVSTTLIEVIVLGALWFMMPPSDPASAISQFAYGLLIGLLLGMGLHAFKRTLGVWMQPLLVVPALIAGSMIVFVYDVHLTEGLSFGTYVYGTCCGIYLLVSAFKLLR
jgi:hypothetical protein